MQEDAPLEPGSCVNASGDHAERSRDQARQWKKERKLQAQRKAEAGKQTDKEPSGKPKSARAIDPYVQLSKALAYLLRHGAEKEHLDVRDDGYIRADTVLLRPKIHKVLIPLQDGMRAPGLEDVRAIVDGNDKKRFELASGSETGPGEGPYTWIRAVQGHSLRQVTELDHTPLTLDNVDKYLACMDEMYYAIHGTDTDAWDAIQESGALRRMTRNHIHLARGLPGASGVISGMRKSCTRLLYVNVSAAMRDGIPFVVSSNGVILTPGQRGELPLAYVTQVHDEKGSGVWP